MKKKALKYRMIPRNCRSNLSNLMICNNEYILISGNNCLHLFDRNLKYVRSNQQMKILEKDLQDLSWYADLNQFVILTKKQIYFMNPLTSRSVNRGGRVGRHAPPAFENFVFFAHQNTKKRGYAPPALKNFVFLVIKIEKKMVTPPLLFKNFVFWS
jgi:hypothetical protein